jgi:hypothetical protein
MPTAGKLLAAVAFALLGFAGAVAYIPLMAPDTAGRGFIPVTVLLGALCGWMVMGPRTGHSWRLAVGAGLSTAAVLVVVALVLFSVNEMVQRSLRGRYGGPMEATVATFGIVIEHAALMLVPGFIALAVLGGVLGGLVAEAGQRRWR